MRITQIKEKFGDLRVFLAGANDAAFDLVHEAEDQSSTTCEWCGAPGQKRQDGWILTLCEICHAKRRKEQSQYD